MKKIFEKIAKVFNESMDLWAEAEAQNHQLTMYMMGHPGLLI